MAGNWSLGTVPAGTDVAYFNGTSVVGCTFSGAISCQGLVTVAAYTGAINLNGQTFTLGSGGMVLDNGTGSTFVLGAATIGITGGPLDNYHCTGWNAGTSAITLYGTCTSTSRAGGSNNFYNLTFAAASTVTIGARTIASHGITLNSAVVLNYELDAITACDLVLNAGASFTGSSYLCLYDSTSTHGLVTLDASVTAPAVVIRKPVSGTRLAAGTYGGLVKAYSISSASILTLYAGSYQFNGGLELTTADGSSITLANNTNGPTITTTSLTIDLDSTGNITINDAAAGAVNWTITGNVVDERTGAGTFTWTKGTGTITFSGAADQNVDLMDRTVEDIVVNKSAGNFVLSGGVTTDTFTGTSTGTGDFDPNGQSITITGDCSWAAAFLFDSAADCMNGCGWDIGGNFTANGQTLKATAAWVLEVTGTAVASGIGAVAYCDASTGTEINASAGPWIDNLNNVHWNFGAGGGTNYTETISDSLGVSDSAARAGEFTREQAESLGVSDVATRFAEYVRSQADSEPVVDVSQAAAEFVRSLADDEDLTDAVAPVADFGRTIAETEGTTDALTRVGVFERALSEALGLTDGQLRAWDALRTIADSEGLTDSRLFSFYLLPCGVAAAQIVQSGVAAGQIVSAGMQAGQICNAGVAAGQIVGAGMQVGQICNAGVAAGQIV